tara:strand:+ start:192 stop:437 length:246 start_codon:yes stop_codon:yes gene_type:complete
MKVDNLVCKASFVGVVLNIVLAMALTPFATKEEINPPKGAGNLSFKSQIMHMLVHHNQVLFTSSLIIAVVVGLSVYIAKLV